MTTVAELSKLTENKLHDSGKNASQAFWCEEKDIEKMELLQGDHVRLKTKGEGPFIGEICYNVLLLISIIFSWPLFFWYIFFLHCYLFTPSGLEAALPVHFSCVRLKENSVTTKQVKFIWDQQDSQVCLRWGRGSVLQWGSVLRELNQERFRNQERTRKNNEQQIVWAEDGHVPTPCPSHDKCFNHWTPPRQLVSQYPLPWDDEQLLIANHRT